MRRAAVALVFALSAGLTACREQAADLIAPRQDALAAPGGGGGGGVFPPFDPFALVFMEISAGDDHTCAKRKNGELVCWGLNESGQLGLGIRTERCASLLWCSSRPRRVTSASFTTAAHVAAGGNHTCATSRAVGEAWCWGANTSGQVGNGTVSGVVLSPSWVLRGIVFQSIAAGTSATCGTSDGMLACWGKAFGSNTPQTSPTNVWWVGGPGFYFSNPSVGGDHACAQALPDVGDWEVRCWGSTQSGQAGVLTKTGVASPFALAQFPANSRPFAGGSMTCALTPTATALCLGFNSNKPKRLGNPLFTDLFTTKPQLVGSGMLFAKLSVGVNHACGLDGNGNAFCWGLGQWGALGGGNETDSEVPQLVLGGHVFTNIAVGAHHTCAVGDDNHLWCWGDNWHGQLGDVGATTFGKWKSSVPVQAVDPVSP